MTQFIEIVLIAIMAFFILSIIFIIIRDIIRGIIDCIHIFFDFVKLMYKFFANSYENTEKNRVCQSLLQLVNVPMRYLYWRCCYKNISRSHREAVYEELKYWVMVSPI